MSSQSSQARAGTGGSRLVASKPGAWNTNYTSQSLSQSQDNASSWAQTMQPRSGNQLDLSSSAFPSLAGGSPQQQVPGAPSSQWQAGPPAREQGQQSNSSRTAQRRQAQPSSGRQSFAPPTAAPSSGNESSPRSDFPAFESQISRYHNQTPTARGAPPGLAPAPSITDPRLRASPALPTTNGGNTNREMNGNTVRSPSPSNSAKQKELPFGPGSSIPTADANQDHYQSLSEKEKWGMAGWAALNDGPAAEYRLVSRSQDLASFEQQSNGQARSLLRTYTGPFARADAFPPRPLASDFHIPECYVVHNVAPIQSRISGFTEDTLFYIFYTSPKDIIQEEVATELMSRKWRFHMKEKMWLTRDDTTASPIILEKDVCEQGVYIWWDYQNWKRARKQYVLRYEDLDDHLSGGRSLNMPGLFQGGFAGAMAAGNGQPAMTGFNAVPGLERMAALTGRF